MPRCALQVELLLQGELFLGRSLPPSRPLRLGPDPSCQVPTSALPTALTLLTPERDGYGLRLSPPLSGAIRAGGRRLRVDQGLLCDPRPEPLRLVAGDGGELVLGDGLLLRFSVVAARPAFRLQPQLDGALLLSLAGTLTVALLVLGLVRFLAPESSAPDREPRLQTRPARLAFTRPGPPQPSTAVPSRPTRPTHRAAVRRQPSPRPARPRGALGLLDPRLAAPAPTRSGSRQDPLAAMDRLLASTTPAARPAGRGADRLADWLAAPVGATLSLPTLGRHRQARLPVPELTAAPAEDTKSTASGGPSREAIREVVALGAGGVRLCYERELLSSTAPREGRILLRWKIDPLGKATALTVLKDGVGLKGLRECLLRQVQSWIFPPCPENCLVVFPFEFDLRS